MSATKNVDLQGLMGMLQVSSKQNGERQTKGSAKHTERADDWTAATKRTVRKSGVERSEEYRLKGNDLFKLGAYEDAIDFYTRAINADPQNEKAFGNRCAANTMMKHFKQAVIDAEYGIRLNPRWAKLYSRKAVAHFYLKEYDESVDAYTKAVDLDPGNQEYLKGLEQAKKEGGSREKLLRKQEREREERQNNHAKSNAQKMAILKNATITARAEEKRKLEWDRYEKALQAYNRDRREALAKWRKSTMREGEYPEEDHGRSIRVDIFGCLRGRSLKGDCLAWERDVDKVHNAWGNMDAIHCSICNHSNSDHESCGPYPMTEPMKPTNGARAREPEIKGIHRAL